MQSDGLSCEDVDECASSSLHDCPQICTNNIGAFTCSCATGFTLTAGVCTADAVGCPLTCTSGSLGCVGTDPDWECSCNTGYAHPADSNGSPDKAVCSDIDECTSKLQINITSGGGG